MKTKKKDEVKSSNKPEVRSFKDIFKMVEIMPEKDFHIVCNQWDIPILEGVSVPIPQRFLKNMVTEGVIKEIPNIKER